MYVCMSLILTVSLMHILGIEFAECVRYEMGKFDKQIHFNIATYLMHVFVPIKGRVTPGMAGKAGKNQS